MKEIQEVNLYLRNKIMNHRLEWLINNRLGCINNLDSLELIEMKVSKLDSPETPYLVQKFQVSFKDGTYAAVEAHSFPYIWEIFFKGAYRVDFDEMSGIEVTLLELTELQRDVLWILSSSFENEGEYLDFLESFIGE